MARQTIRDLLQRHPVLATLGGLAVGLIGAGLVAVFIMFVIQPLMTRETWDRTSVRGEYFTLWYQEESPSAAGAHGLLDRLDGEIEDLMELLGVDESALSFPVDVFVHDDLSQLLQSISRRKGSQTGNLAYGEIDLLAGEDPRQRLAELVMAFGWGRVYSQVLYIGAVANATYPDRDFHSIIAAAPERLAPSMDDVLEAEADGRLEETLYQLYDSPFSSRMLPGLAELRKFYGLMEGIKPPLEELVAEYAASLVQYLIETYGYEGLRTIWGPGTTRVLVERLAGTGLDLFEAQWIETARPQGRTASDYPYQKARLALESGDVGGAYELAHALQETSSASTQDLLVRTELATGRFSEAAERCEAQGEAVEGCAFVGLYAESRVIEGGRLRILGPEDADLETILETAQRTVASLETRLGLVPETFPDRVSIFVYRTEEDAARGSSLVLADSIHRTMIHVVASGDIDIELAEQLTEYVTQSKPISSLLQRGIAIAAVRSFEVLRAEAHALLEAEAWIALPRVDYNIGYPAQTVDTEVGFLFSSVLGEFGAETLLDLWVASARGRTLDTALLTVIGMTRASMEDDLVERAWTAPGEGE